MFKILLCFSISGSLDGGKGCSMEVIEFENVHAANIAFRKINDAGISGLKAIALY